MPALTRLYILSGAIEPGWGRAELSSEYPNIDEKQLFRTIAKDREFIPSGDSNWSKQAKLKSKLGYIDITCVLESSGKKKVQSSTTQSLTNIRGFALQGFPEFRHCRMPATKFYNALSFPESLVTPLQFTQNVL